METGLHEGIDEGNREKCGSKTTFCNWEAAREFLGAIDPDATGFTFQTVSDDKSLKKVETTYPGIAPGDVAPRGTKAKTKLVDPNAKIYNGAVTESLCERLEKQNQKRAGIFFAVNETDLKGREKHNIRRVRAVWADFDNGLPESFPIKPSALVCSSPGRYHAYWIVGDEMSFETFRGVMVRIVRDYGGDANVMDIARVLRLPGTCHMKTGKPHLVTVEYVRDQGGFVTAYRAATIVKAFPPVEIVTREAAAHSTIRTGLADIQHIVSALDHIAHLPSEFDPHQSVVRNRATWFKVLCALKHEYDDAGLSIALDWSKQVGADVYDEDNAQAVWTSINKGSYSGKPCTVGTIFHWAKEAGWSAANARLHQALASAVVPLNHAENDKPAMSVASISNDTTALTQIAWPVTNKQNKEGQEVGTPIARAPRNISHYLKCAGIHVVFNEFDMLTYVRRNGKLAVLSDAIIGDIYIDLSNAGCLSSKDLVADVIRKVGRETPVHPVRRYLDKLHWDGRPRLETLLPHYANTADTALNRAMGKAWMIAAVRRVRQPGVKVDAMLALQGAQGAGKSSFFRTLASSEWFSDSLDIGVNAKDFIENSSGAWIIEHAEMSGYSKKEINDVKRYITAQEDKARVAFARVAETVPRQCVFGSTTNNAQFLNDDTGSRRFWVAEVGTVRLEELGRDRDDLWAEAAFLEEQGKSHNIAPDLWGDAAKANKCFEVVDPVAERTAEILLGLGKNATVPNADLCMAMGIRDVTKRGGSVGRSMNKGARECGWLSERTNQQRFLRSEGADDAATAFAWNESSGALVGKRPQRV